MGACASACGNPQERVSSASESDAVLSAAKAIDVMPAGKANVSKGLLEQQHFLKSGQPAVVVERQNSKPLPAQQPIAAAFNIAAVEIKETPALSKTIDNLEAPAADVLLVEDVVIEEKAAPAAVDANKAPGPEAPCCAAASTSQLPAEPSASLNSPESLPVAKIVAQIEQQQQQKLELQSPKQITKLATPPPSPSILSKAGTISTTAAETTSQLCTPVALKAVSPPETTNSPAIAIQEAVAASLATASAAAVPAKLLTAANNAASAHVLEVAPAATGAPAPPPTARAAAAASSPRVRPPHAAAAPTASSLARSSSQKSTASIQTTTLAPASALAGKARAAASAPATEPKRARPSPPPYSTAFNYMMDGTMTPRTNVLTSFLPGRKPAILVSSCLAPGGQAVAGAASGKPALTDVVIRGSFNGPPTKKAPKKKYKKTPSGRKLVK